MRWITDRRAEIEFRAGVMLFFAGRFEGVSDHVRCSSAVETALAAEAEGIDDIWVGEHHYLQHSNPSALTLASYLLSRTTRARVGTAVTLLPLHNPVHIAEQAALLDLLSNGRFDLGLGRGAQTVDYEVMSSLQRWEQGMPASLELLMRSFARPHPPVLVASESDATLSLAARHGLPCMFFVNQNQDVDAVANLVRRHAAIAAEHGRSGPWQHTILVYAQVADTEEEAADVIRGPLQRAMKTKAAEYVWIQESWRQQPDHTAYLESLIEHHAIGTPATCVDRLAGLVERSGVSRVILVVESAATPGGVLDNVQRLGREVLPAVRERLGITSDTGMRIQ